MPPGVRDMVRDFKDQTLMNPRLKNTVGHILLSFSAQDADRLSDLRMTLIAREYMDRMGIRDTQFLIVRHTDQPHPHCHIVYNRIANDGRTLSDRNSKIRNGKVCKELTAKYGLYYPKGKEHVRREPDKTKYRIYDAIRGCLPGCPSWSELEGRLQAQGVAMRFKVCGGTGRRQGVVFSANGYTFPGSKVDRAFGFGQLDRHFLQAQCVATSAAPQGPSAQAAGRLSVAVKDYRAAFEGLYGVPDACGAWADTASLEGLGVRGGLTLPPRGHAGAIAPEQMQRRAGESPEEYIARIAVLILRATQAMLNEWEERNRRIRAQQATKRRFKMH